jgi:hypothetical protein
MWPKSFDLVSPLAREECVRHLRANTESPWVPAVFSKKPVAGDVGDTWFSLRKHIAYRNPFQPLLSGDLLDEGGRTRVRCDLDKIRLSVIAFMVLWFGFVLIIGGRMAVMSAIRAGALAAAWPDIVPLAIMLAGGAAFVGLGLFLARNEQRFLLDFLRDTIAAREA